MTKTIEKYGSLSKSLKNFLELPNDEAREKVYGKNKAKLYERIVKNVQESFVDAVLAYNRLPPEHSRKIDLNQGFNMVQEEIMKQKSQKDKANFAISQARQALRVINHELTYPAYFTKVFGKDFDKVQDWLVVLDNIDLKLKEKKKYQNEDYD